MVATVPFFPALDDPCFSDGSIVGAASEDEAGEAGTVIIFVGSIVGAVYEDEVLFPDLLFAVLLFDVLLLAPLLFDALLVIPPLDDCFVGARDVGTGVGNRFGE